MRHGNKKLSMICRNCVTSYINDDNSSTNSEGMMSKNLDMKAVGQSYADTIGLPWQFSL